MQKRLIQIGWLSIHWTHMRGFDDVQIQVLVYNYFVHCNLQVQSISPSVNDSLSVSPILLMILLMLLTSHCYVLWVGTYTKHTISNFIYYESFFLSYRAFVSSLSSVPMPQNWKEELANLEWQHAEVEEMRTLDKKNMYELVPLPLGKKDSWV